jgi:hypothetical protein
MVVLRHDTGGTAMTRLLAVALVAVVAWFGYQQFVAPAEDSPAPTAREAQAGGNAPQSKRLIARVDRVRTVEGIEYRVRPTRAGRLIRGDGLTAAWRQAVRAGVPDRQGLQQQFLCHPLSVVARGKPTWDLETWRPTVGLTRTMLAGCNPGPD